MWKSNFCSTATHAQAKIRSRYYNSSVAGQCCNARSCLVPATKHAQQGLAHGLRMEVKEFGINVSLIEPGYIDSDIDNASFPWLDKAEQHPQRIGLCPSNENVPGKMGDRN